MVFDVRHDYGLVLRLVHLGHRDILLLVKTVTLVSDMLPLLTQVLLTLDDAGNQLEDRGTQAYEYIRFK